MLKNNRIQQKYAYGFRGGDVASWISKYGSVTFNQIGKEFPYGGINEKGLVIEQLWLSNSEYQDNKSATISELEWIQYQLDQYDSVDEVIKNVHTLTIKPIATVHYFLADARGVSAVIEFINGEAVIDRKQDRTQVITNETSADSQNYFSGLSNIDRTSRHALDRYSILRQELNVQSLSVSEAFSKLKTVEESQADYKTYGSIVYDIDKLEIYYSSLSHPNIKKVSLSDFNFAQNTVTEFARINTDQTSFTFYSPADNLKLVENTAKMMNIEFDVLKANAHQMQPGQMVTDEIFRNRYTDLLVKFVTKNTKGNIWYTVANDEESFTSYRGFLRGIIPAKTTVNRKMLYGVAQGTLAIASFQDTNSDQKIDTNFLGIPINTGFSNNKKRIFGIPPKFKTAKINTETIKELEICIK